MVTAEPQHSRRLAGKVALVTGASRGIGRAVALAYALEGAHVILAARSVGALEEVDDEIRAAGGNATLIPLDLRKPDKIDALGPTLYQRWQHLDIFVGNAGVLGPLSPLGHISDRDWTETMEVNLTANWRLIRTLDPLLRRAEAGRVIFVTSGAPRKCRAYWGPYSVSKAALEALAKTYAAETAKTPLCVNLVNPGPTRTKMRATAVPGEDPSTVPNPAAVAPIFVELALPGLDRSGEIIEILP